MPLRFPLAAAPRTVRLLRVPQIPRRLIFSTRSSPSKHSRIGPKSNNFLIQSQPQHLFSSSSQRCSTNTVVRVPAMAESITEGTLVQLTKQIGDYVEQDEELATIETDKIDVAVNAPHSGVIQRLLASEGDTVTVDQSIVELQRADSTSSEKSSSTEKQECDSEIAKRERETATEPVASSPVESTENRPSSTHTAKGSRPIQDAVQEEPGSGAKHERGETRIKMTRIRKKTAEHLKQSQNTAAFLTTFNEVDMSKLMDFRKMNKDSVLKQHGIKLGYMGAMARASALALGEIPAVNAAIEDGDTIVYRGYVDLSVAAAIPKGLVTPVLRNIESMGLVEIEKNISKLVAKARDGKLTMDDLTGGSFTISNSGVWGSLFGTPIINMPQTAVLGVYGIQDRPVSVNNQVEIRPMMYIALTYDHRIIDGREAVKFLTLVKGYLEDPNTMLLQ
ncbi:hypothetical protein N7509_011239 [Penicillium cosmopolitanum]|uniref:dihydrolipoyllysine-residue succinyltransferase n=1 Tax=Penicillium cosmopolitanum TaxID=1131564 RepID=A0A9X0B5C0_9EURO|nr:uncharacterized protein N7509_011239 [Penicillium cosmopolitanum]KAJ5388698.1 hypothetical protein N7509_011239 [Penicillium cosmopolitanum]